jgi:engulfment and cell motility protein 1
MGPSFTVRISLYGNHYRTLTLYCRQVRDDLGHEALQFVKEQRIRCLLNGAWFPAIPNSEAAGTKHRAASTGWRFVRLSHNRRFLQWVDRDTKCDPPPGLDDLKEKSKAPLSSRTIKSMKLTYPSRSVHRLIGRFQRLRLPTSQLR